MKKYIFIFLIVGSFVNICYAEVTREELYQKFGPMLVEAIVQVTKDEINLVRKELGLPERTNAQILTAVENKLNQLEKYDWMKEQPNLK